MLKGLTPNLIVSDVNRTVDFYTIELGFSVIMSVPPEGTFDWAMVQCDNASIMFQSAASMKEALPDLINPDTGGQILYIETDSIKDLYEKFKGKDYLVRELHEEFYGMTEFAVKDPDNFLIIFAERNEQ